MMINRKEYGRVMLNKKAESDPMKFLVGAIIVIVVGILILMFYKNSINDVSGHNPVDLLNKDCDNDGLIDSVDPCICDDVEICKYGSAQEKKECRENIQNNCK